jgi:hypothetical protein
MARLEGLPPARAGLFTRLAYWVARRRLRRLPEPLTVMAHQPKILAAVAGYETMLERARLVDARLKTLAGLKAAALIGCHF